MQKSAITKDKLKKALSINARTEDDGSFW